MCPAPGLFFSSGDGYTAKLYVVDGFYFTHDGRQLYVILNANGKRYRVGLGVLKFTPSKKAYAERIGLRITPYYDVRGNIAARRKSYFRELYQVARKIEAGIQRGEIKFRPPPLAEEFLSYLSFQTFLAMIPTELVPRGVRIEGVDTAKLYADLGLIISTLAIEGAISSDGKGSVGAFQTLRGTHERLRKKYGGLLPFNRCLNVECQFKSVLYRTYDDVVLFSRWLSSRRKRLHRFLKIWKNLSEEGRRDFMVQLVALFHNGGYNDKSRSAVERWIEDGGRRPLYEYIGSYRNNDVRAYVKHLYSIYKEYRRRGYADVQFFKSKPLEVVPIATEK